MIHLLLFMKTDIPPTSKYLMQTCSNVSMINTFFARLFESISNPAVSSNFFEAGVETSSYISTHMFTYIFLIIIIVCLLLFYIVLDQCLTCLSTAVRRKVITGLRGSWKWNVFTLFYGLLFPYMIILPVMEIIDTNADNTYKIFSKGIAGIAFIFNIVILIKILVSTCRKRLQAYNY